MGNLSFNTLRKLSKDENDYRNAVKAVERFLDVMENEFHENATVSQKKISLRKQHFSKLRLP